MTPRLKKLVRSWRTWVVAAAVVAIVLDPDVVLPLTVVAAAVLMAAPARSA
jgi:hypothetical protein